MAAAKKGADQAQDAPAALVSMTQEQMQAIIAAAVSAGVTAAVGAAHAQNKGRRLVGHELVDRVKNIRHKRPGFARPPMPMIPAVGQMLVTDRNGDGMKSIDLYLGLLQGLTITDFGDITTPRPTGLLVETIISGDRQVKAFTPYPDGVLSDSVGDPVDTMKAIPKIAKRSIASTMVEVAGTYFHKDYLELVNARMKAEAEKAATAKPDKAEEA